MRDEVELERLTWPEVQAALEAGWTTAIVACGAVEQHGPHLPLCVDAAHGAALAERVARGLGHALVAPTIRVGCSEHHLAFPGTISLHPATFEAVCRDYCTSLAHHGFRRICLIPSHGGNFAPLAEMEQRLDERVGPDCRVIVFSDLQGLIEVWRSAVLEAGGDPDDVGGHADVAESSVYSYLRPGAVRTDQLARGYTGPVDDAVLQRLFTGGIRALSDTGVMGDPHGLSDAIGELCVQRVADMIAASFTDRMQAGARDS